MAIQQLTLKNFRCFSQATFNFSAPIILIEGPNGSGKSSLLEALHYSCYLRSFRTHLPMELANDNNADFRGFSLQLTTEQSSLFIGIHNKERVVKIDGVAITKYQQLIAEHKIVTFIEDDLAIIAGYPEARRTFLDNALIVQDAEYYEDLRLLRKIVAQRTKLLQEPRFDEEEYTIWTEKLTEVNLKIVTRRKSYLKQLQEELEKLSLEYGENNIMRLEYQQKHYSDLVSLERLRRRTLFGAHHDDIDITIYQRNTRNFASRGQQKLALMLLKIAQARLLKKETLIFLIDDFLTDFDAERITKLFSLLCALSGQLIITLPQENKLMSDLCNRQATHQKIVL